MFAPMQYEIEFWTFVEDCPNGYIYFIFNPVYVYLLSSETQRHDYIRQV